MERGGKGETRAFLARKLSGSGEWWFLDVCKLLAWPSFAAVFRTKRIYEDPSQRACSEGGFLILSNHASYFDPLIILQAFFSRRVMHLTSQGVFEGHPLSAWFLRHFGCVPIDKGNCCMGSLTRLVEILQSGGAVTIFPEGELSARGELLPFKCGAVLVAKRAGAPIVPVYLNSSEPLWKRRKIVIGRPVDVAALLPEPNPSLARIEAVSALLHDKLLSLRALLET